MNEEIMRVYVCEAAPMSTEETELKAFLINRKEGAQVIPLENCGTNPLFIAVNEGQQIRMQKNFEATTLDGSSVGYWSLTGQAGYLSKNGVLNKEKFTSHAVVFFANPERVHPQFRGAYMDLIQKVREMM